MSNDPDLIDVLVECPTCGGTGEYPDPDPCDERFYRCPSCDGTGEVAA